jgi:hypothetical protein
MQRLSAWLLSQIWLSAIGALATAAWASTVLLSWACSSAPNPVDVPAVAAISLAPSDSTLWVGQSIQLRMTAHDSHGAPITPSGLAWTSSNPLVAEVTSNGQVTGVGSGQVTVTARVGSVSGTAVLLVQVRPAGVVSVRLDVPVSKFEVADTLGFAATPLDADKQPMANRTITWTSNNPDIVSILPAGFFTAVSPGTASVTATVDGVSAQTTITVVPQSGPVVPWPHEPTGSVMLTERTFSVFGEKGWYDQPNAVNYFTVEDPTAPVSPPTVGQMRFPAGFSSNGSSPAVAEMGLGGSATTVYTSFWIKLSTNWSGHSSGVNKILHYWIGGSNHVVAEAFGSGSDPLKPIIAFQGIANMGGAATLPPNLVPTMRIVRGKWQRWELVLKTNSAGTPNGSVEWWIDGVRVGSYQNIQVIPGAGGWEGVQWNPTWGGVGGPNVPAEQFMWMDHIYVSGR